MTTLPTSRVQESSGASATAPVLPHTGLVAIGGRDWMGGANYVQNLSAAIHLAEPAAKVTWVCGQGMDTMWQRVSPRVKIRKEGRLRRWLRLGPDRAKFRRKLDKAGIEFLYPLTYDNFYNLGLHFPLAEALQGRAWAGWIPDFQHRYLPQLFCAEELFWRDKQIGMLIEEAPQIVLSSQAALADFQEFYPDHAHKGTVLTFRVPPVDTPDDEAFAASLPERFFLVCNQFWKHKNHQVVFQALRILRARGYEPPLLCTGALEDYRGDEYLQTLRNMLAEPGLRAQVQLLGLVSREQLVTMMRRSLAIVQPSLFEGWSTVVEDARTYGRPSLLSDIPVHREQSPPGAQFFGPHDDEALADLMEKAWLEGKPGPDYGAEYTARMDARGREERFGHDFLALATRCVQAQLR